MPPGEGGALGGSTPGASVIWWLRTNAPPPSWAVILPDTWGNIGGLSHAGSLLGTVWKASLKGTGENGVCGVFLFVEVLCL